MEKLELRREIPKMLRILKCKTQAIVAAPRFRIGQFSEGFNELGARPLYGRMALSDWDNIPDSVGERPRTRWFGSALIWNNSNTRNQALQKPILLPACPNGTEEFPAKRRHALQRLASIPNIAGKRAETGFSLSP